MKISVVIPAYNVQDWLGDAIESVLAQQPVAHEVIVVDDGSIDATSAVAARYGGRVQLFRQKNQGLAGARNAGTQIASGDVVYFLDADDLMLPGALAAVRRAFQIEPRAGAVTGNYRRREPDGKEEVAWVGEAEDSILHRSDLPGMLRKNRLSSHCALRREVLQEFPYDPQWTACEDLDLWVRLLLADIPIITLASALTVYRVGRMSALTGDKRAMRKCRNQLFRRLLSNPVLSRRERVTVAYQVARTELGRRGGRRSRQGPAKPKPSRCMVLHVGIDEAGGGPIHIDELRSGLGGQVTSEVMLLKRGNSLNPLTWYRYGRAVSSRARELRPAILHAHGVYAAAAVRVARQDARHVVTVHGLHLLRRTRGAARVSARFLNRAALRAADLLLVMSESDRRTLLEEGLGLDSRIQLIRAVLPTRPRVDRTAARGAFGLDEDAFVIAWLGRFDEQKDPLSFVRVVAHLRFESRVTAIMAGDGYLMPKVRREVHRENLDERVLLPGWVANPSVVMAAADAFVMTSRWEGFPQVGIEAAAAGVPIVVFDTPGSRDLIEQGVLGSLVRGKDPSAMAEVLRELKARRGEAADRLDNGAELVSSKFSRDNLANDVLRAYRSLLGESLLQDSHDGLLSQTP